MKSIPDEEVCILVHFEHLHELPGWEGIEPCWSARSEQQHEEECILLWSHCHIQLQSQPRTQIIQFNLYFHQCQVHSSQFWQAFWYHVAKMSYFMHRYPFPKYHFLPSIQCKLYTYFYAIYLDLVTNKPNKISSLSALHVSWNYGKYFY